MPTYPIYKLGEIAKIYNGNSINAEEKEKKYKGVDGRNYIGTKDIDFECSVNYNNGVKIPYDEGKFKIAPAESVLVCAEGGSAGKKSAFITEDVCFGNKLFAITNNQGLFDGKYVFYYTRYKRFFDLFKNELSGLIGGVSSKKFGEIPIPLPPLTTQRAIVSRIETLFAELDKAVQYLRTAQQQLKTYRQAVLKAAFEGCENAEKHLFGELMADVRNGYGAKPTDCGTNKLLRISSVRAMNLNLDDFRFNNSSFDERDIIQENDLLFTRYNGSVDLVGVCAYVPELYDTYAYPDKIIRCRPKVCNTFHSKFLQYYINQGKAREFVRSKIKTTSGQNGISGSDIKKIEIPLPPLAEQQRIVKEIESRLSQATASETYIENALQQAEALRQSILKKAFSGELV